MPKMTAKYSLALDVARREAVSFLGVTQEILYTHLQEMGYFWESGLKEWNYSDPAHADEPTVFLLVRVWANEEIIHEVADDTVKGLRKLYMLVERSEPYRCRPPKQREARIYLRFLPKSK